MLIIKDDATKVEKVRKASDVKPAFLNEWWIG
jgi:hypothetical protein